MGYMKYLEELIARYPVLEPVKGDIADAYDVLEDCFASGHKLLVAGNGGSAADSEHVTGELMKGFVLKRPVPEEMAKRMTAVDSEAGKILADNLEGSLPALSLTGNIGLSTAYLNDVDGRLVYAQQVYGYGDEGDVFLAISTSGNSRNIYYAAVAAKAVGIRVIALTGKGGGKLKDVSDVSIIVPENETYKIQELHLPIYHALSLMLEEHFFGED